MRRKPIRRTSRSRAASSRGRTRYYVYALLDSGALASRRLPAAIDIVPAGDLFAAIERLAVAPSLSEAALRRQHDIVVALARAADAILPVRFGALLEPEELAGIVRLRRDPLRRALQRVRGQEQMTLRIFGSPVARASVRRPASGADYLLGRVQASRARMTPAARALAEAVRPLVSAQRIDNGQGAVQVTLHHLVRQGSGARYVKRIESEVARMEAPPSLTVSGPWPPFAFVPDIWSPDSLDSEDAWVPV